MPLTKQRNQYLLVIEDYYSKWIEAFPLQRTVAPSVAQCVLNGWISRFGCPYSILSDQGPEFESKLFKSLNNMLQTKKLRTTTYHPRTDGMVERSNRTIINVLSKYAEGEADWDLKIPLVLFALRTSEHATTGFSPFALTYGREARLPWDIMYGPAPNTPMPLNDWVADRKEHMSKIFKMVRERTSRQQLMQKEYFDKNRSGKFQTFEENELVMFFDPACRSKEGKLHRAWSGPHKVVEKLTDALYKLEIKPGVEKIVNAERMKKYFQRTGVGALPNMLRECEEESEDSEDEVERRGVYEHEANEDNQLGEALLHQEEDPQDQREPPRGEPGERLPPRAEPDNEPIMGHRGEKWCNVDPRNVMEGGKRRGRR